MIRILTALLRHLLPGDWATDILRDLEEDYSRRRARTGPVRARWWLLGQSVHLAVRFALERLRDAKPAGGPAAWLRAMLQDLRFTLRSLRRSPVFFGGIVLTLAVGMGANAAIFSVVRSVVLAPLPYPEPDRLMVVDPYPWTPAEIVQNLGDAGPGTPYAEVAGYYPRPFTSTGGERPEELQGATVTPSFFGILGATMALGRRFTADDVRADAPRTAVLSYEAWQRLFGGDPAVLGRTLTLDGLSHEIVGVTAGDFRPLLPRTERSDVWTPATMDQLGADVLPEGSIPWAIPLVRIRSGIPLARAQESLRTAVGRFRDRHPDESGGGPSWTRWEPLKSDVTGAARGPLFILQAAVGVVLILACVNVANLLLVRLGARRGELAVRTALGASRGQIARQLVTESVVLAVLGALAGLFLVAVSLRLIVSIAPPDLPRLDRITLDIPVFVFALGVALATGLAFGVAPALYGGGSPHRSMRESARTATGSRHRHRVSQGLVIAEVTLTVVLVASAGLLVRSFSSLIREDPGFDTSDVLAVPLVAPEERFTDVPALERYQTGLLEELARVPGVASVALANNLPLSRGNATRSLVLEGESEPHSAQYGVVSEDYFRTLGIPVRRGRSLRATDTRTAAAVAVVDESMARSFWPDADAVGRRFRFEDDSTWITVVGVSGSIRGRGLAQAPEPGFHISYRQRPESPVELDVGKRMALLVRTRPGTASLANLSRALREAVWRVDRGQPIPAVDRLRDLVAGDAAPQRFRATLVGAFAALALLLALAGVYGVVANLLTERVHEFGIRRALGATHADIVRTVFTWGLRLAAAGLVLGLLGAAWVGHLLSRFLYGVGSADPVSLTASALVVAAITLAACLVPAWRALRLRALATLRSD